ncbi:MAG: hypothetical protein O7F12_07410 [Nitrospirae bacterium]|nr:hypothetical protein [Nitrospirota bacterium]
MKKLAERTVATFLASGLLATPAFANVPGGGYEGITGIYYSVIAIVLAYGVYDIWFKKE